MFATLCPFFLYHTIRLIYLNVFGSIPTEHRRAGIYVGAVAFSIATFGFRWLSWPIFRFVRSLPNAQAAIEPRLPPR
jgi:hypothetical protein